MRTLLIVTAATGPVPDFAFLTAHGFAVTSLPDNTPDLAERFSAYHIVVIACETRTTEHARIWWQERALSLYVRNGGRLLFTGPSFGAWAFVWSAFPVLLPVTPLKTYAPAENFSDRFRWVRDKENARSFLVRPSDHPVCAGLRDWPAFHRGGLPGSYNAYDFEHWAPKPHTDVALTTEDGQVALSFMPFGAGRTGFLLADVHDDAGASWAAWPDREKFWAALLHHLDIGELRIARAPAGLVPFEPRLPLVRRPRFAFARGPRTGNPDWPRVLTRTDWTMLADNQIAVNVSGNPIAREPAVYGDGWFRDARAEPGIGHVKFYPPAHQFDAALSVDLVVAGRVVELQPVPDAHCWQPHLRVNRFASADGALVLEQRQCVADDLVCVELHLVHGRADSVRLRGWNRHHGFLRNGDAHSLLGQIESGAFFGVAHFSGAASASAPWTTREAPLRYETEISFSSDSASAPASLHLAFTAALELRDVESRLAAFHHNPALPFAAAFAKWDNLFMEQVPAFRSDDPLVERLVYGAFFGYLVNLYDIPYEPWRDPHSCPSKMHFDPQWEQDDVQVATIAKWLRDPSVISRQLLRPFRLGFMLNVNAALGPIPAERARGLVGELQQYSVPLRERYLFTRDSTLRRALLDALLREDAENDAHTPVDPATGLLCTYNCLGMDDSPRWDMVSPGQKAEWFQSFVRPIITPEVNATSAHRAAFIAELLAEEGDPRAESFRARAADRARRIRQHLWSETAGFFVDRIAGEAAFSDVLTPMGFAPLLLGPSEVAARAARTLDDESVFKTPYGLPTVARAHPKFDAMSYWRGSIWSRTNWFAVEAVHAAGLRAQTAELTRRWLALVLKNGSDLRENFNPLTGDAKCATMFTEGLAGMADVYLKNIVGFRPTWDGFDLDPVALDAATPSFTFGPFRYREREITIAWDRATARGELCLDSEPPVHWTAGVRQSFGVNTSA